MKIEVKAIRSKPQVSLNVAVGKLTLTADDLADSAILTAIYRAMARCGVTPRLTEAIGHDAVIVASEWKNAKETFEMLPPKKRKA